MLLVVAAVLLIESSARVLVGELLLPSPTPGGTVDVIPNLLPPIRARSIARRVWVLYLSSFQLLLVLAVASSCTIPLA